MTELGEPVGISLGHTAQDDKCPFCPPKARKEYKTFPGEENESSDLAAIMLNPGSLLTRKKGGPGARPQTSAEEENWVVEQAKPAARVHPETWYTFQAHHLISGNQAMKGEPIEDWIKASGKNEKPTGYSINNTYNGYWAPSMPQEHLNGKWGKLSPEKKQEEAERVMKAAVAQIHISHHSVKDLDGEIHQSYDTYLKKRLKELSDRINLWAGACLCEKDANKKPQATHRVHDAIDAVSDHMQGKITGGVGGWEVFLSKYAKNYHEKPGNCLHGLNVNE